MIWGALLLLVLPVFPAHADGLSMEFCAHVAAPAVHPIPIVGIRKTAASDAREREGLAALESLGGLEAIRIEARAAVEFPKLAALIEAVAGEDLRSRAFSAEQSSALLEETLGTTVKYVLGFSYTVQSPSKGTVEKKVPPLTRADHLIHEILEIYGYAFYKLALATDAQGNRDPVLENLAGDWLIRLIRDRMAFALTKLRPGDQTTPDDITSHLYFRVLGIMARGKIRDGAHLASWLADTAAVAIEELHRLGTSGVLRNSTSFDEPASKRNNGRHPLTLLEVLPNGAPSALDNLENEEKRALLHRALQYLQPSYRNAVYLQFIEGYSQEETADALGTSVGTIKANASRGNAELRLLFANMFGEPNPEFRKLTPLLARRILDASDPREALLFTEGAYILSRLGSRDPRTLSRIVDELETRLAAERGGRASVTPSRLNVLLQATIDELAP